MDISIGKTILEAAISLDKGLGKIDGVISNIDDEAERNAWKIRLGNTIGVIYKEIIYPIEKEFPELSGR